MLFRSAITKQTIEAILDLKLKGAISMVSYFFDNKDIFELLAFCAYGTKHEHFLDEIIEQEDKNHLKSLYSSSCRMHEEPGSLSLAEFKISKILDSISSLSFTLTS